MRNESLLLPFWIQHYGSFCDRLIIYDDGSDDGTTELALEAKVEIRPCPWQGLDDMANADFSSIQYREAHGQSDWVIWVDADEFLYHQSIALQLDYLKSQGVTLPIVQGYSMFATGVPDIGSGQIYEQFNRGVFDERYSKPVILNPEIDMQWGPGKHEFSSNGLREIDQPNPLKLLHYRWFGREAYLDRNAKNLTVLSDRNIAFGLGVEVWQTNYAGHHSLAWYEQMEREAQPCL